ncbi:MAG: hypothetical protein JKY42_05875 [Flavobacteriales bacterium]|nr:hypothetical protein [Flavobacteriales bacterium]
MVTAIESSDGSIVYFKYDGGAYDDQKANFLGDFEQSGGPSNNKKFIFLVNGLEEENFMKIVCN